MAGKSQYLENLILNWMKGNTFAGAPSTVYCALYTTAPTDDSGTGSVEVSGGSYARASITTSSGWSAISGAPGAPAQISNSGTVTFATATASWGTVVAIGMYDASSGGNLLYWNGITGLPIANTTVASFAPNALILSDD